MTFTRLALVVLCLPLLAARAQFAQKIIVAPRDSSLWHSPPERTTDGSATEQWFRFYSDGTVISVTTASTPDSLQGVERWFHLPYETSGKYAISGSTIAFSIKLPEVKSGKRVYPASFVDYKGTISDDTSMILNVYSDRTKWRDVVQLDMVWEPQIECPSIYKQTSTKKVSDLTVNEDRLVKACESAHYYHP
jgi:hypothetical protein